MCVKIMNLFTCGEEISKLAVSSNKNSSQLATNLSVYQNISKNYSFKIPLPTPPKKYISKKKLKNCSLTLKKLLVFQEGTSKNSSNIKKSFYFFLHFFSAERELFKQKYKRKKLLILSFTKKQNFLIKILSYNFLITLNTILLLFFLFLL